MEGLQVASAFLSLIEAAAWTAIISKKLYRADKTARSLRTQADGLNRLLSDIQGIVTILINNQSRRHGVTRQTRALFENMLKCFTACSQSLEDINEKLKKFVEGERPSFRAKISFVFTGEKEINRMANTIDGHLQQLHLFFTTLNGLSQAIDSARAEQQLERLESLIIFLINSDREMTEMRQSTSMGITSGSSTSPRPTYRQTRMIEDSSAHLMQLADILPTENAERGSSPRQADAEPRLILARSRSIEIDESVISDEDDGSSYGGSPAASRAPRQQLIDTPLAKAVKNNNSEDVRRLIESGTALDVVDRDGWTLLHHAVARKAKDALLALLESEQGRAADFINALDYKKQTALMICADKHNDSATGYSMAKMLIEHDAEVNIEDTSRRTALYLVVQQTVRPHRQKFANLLVEHGADFGVGCSRAPGCARDYQNIKPILQHLKRVNSGASDSDPRRLSAPVAPARRSFIMNKVLRRQSAS